MFKTLITLHALSLWVTECTPNPGQSFQLHPALASVHAWNLTQGLFVDVIPREHSQFAQCSWENPLQTIHLDDCSLTVPRQWGTLKIMMNAITQDSLPVWGKESADSQNTYWDLARQIRGGDSHCSNWPYLRVRLGQERRLPAWGRGQHVWRPWGLSPLRRCHCPRASLWQRRHICTCVFA
jgi:hypothetical protein